jgi:DNA mismatch endonuclease, patch repair protein
MARRGSQRSGEADAGAELHSGSEIASPTPPASSAAVRRRMQATPRRDTPAELALRSALHRLGLRFRVQHPIAGVPRTRPDIVFTRARVVVFVDGCFWHGCPEHGTMPKTNREWWADKLAANFERDRRHDSALAAAGWTVVRVWEHENPSAAALRVSKIVGTTRTAPGPLTPRR